MEGNPESFRVEKNDVGKIGEENSYMSMPENHVPAEIQYKAMVDSFLDAKSPAARQSMVNNAYTIVNGRSKVELTAEQLEAYRKFLPWASAFINNTTEKNN